MNKLEEFNRVYDKIKEYESIFLCGHINPDADSLGTQLALRELIKNNLSNKKVYLTGEDSQNLSFIVKMDNISDEVIEKSLCIVVDTSIGPRVADSRYIKAKEIINLDHHPISDDAKVEGNSSICASIVDTNYAAAAHLVYDFMITLDLKYNKDVLNGIYIGIRGDTGRFKHPNSTPEVHEIVADLIRKGAEFNKMSIKLDDEDYRRKQITGLLLAKNNLFEFKNVVISLITNQDLIDSEIGFKEVSKTVSIIQNTSEKDVAVLLIENKEKNNLKGSLRSKDKEIRSVAVKYNGGGHPLASGVSPNNWKEGLQLIEEVLTEYTDGTLEEINEFLIEIIDLKRV